MRDQVDWEISGPAKQGLGLAQSRWRLDLRRGWLELDEGFLSLTYDNAEGQQVAVIAAPIEEVEWRWSRLHPGTFKLATDRQTLERVRFGTGPTPSEDQHRAKWIRPEHA